MQELKSTFILRQKRDLGELIGGTFRFVSYHFSTLLPSILIIAGPFILFTAYAQSEAFYIRSILFGNGFSSNSQAWYIFNFALPSVAFLLVVCIIHAHARLQELNQKINVPAIAGVVKSYFFKVLTLFFSQMIILSFFTLLFLFSRFIGFFLTSNSIASLVIAIGAISIVGIYIFTRFSLTYTFGLFEHNQFFYALGRSWEFTKGYFWQTCTLVLFFFLLFLPVSLLINYIARYLYEFDFSPMVFRIMFWGLNFFKTLVLQLSLALLIIVLLLQYYNIGERKEQISTLQKLNEIGRDPENPVTNKEGSDGI